MMEESRRKLSLDRPATYQIKVPGCLEQSWTEWTGEMTITIDKDEDGASVSILTGLLDQAALLGLLRRLYSLGLPLISVICVDEDCQP